MAPEIIPPAGISFAHVINPNKGPLDVPQAPRPAQSEVQVSFSSASVHLQQAEAYFSSHLDASIRAQFCIVPFWNNEEEIRRKAIKRSNDMQKTKVSLSAAQDEDIVTPEVGFSSGMLSLFLASPAEQREIVRRVTRFAQMLRENKQRGGVYFLDDTHAVIWTQAEEETGENGIAVQWMHPHTLSVRTMPSPLTARPPSMRIQPQPKPVWQQTPEALRPRAANGAKKPPVPSISNIPRMGFFRGYEN